jgi:hypothetical protein
MGQPSHLVVAPGSTRIGHRPGSKTRPSFGEPDLMAVQGTPSASGTLQRLEPARIRYENLSLHGFRRARHHLAPDDGERRADPHGAAAS